MRVSENMQVQDGAATVAAPEPEGRVGMRHVTILLLFISTTIAYATRVSISVAIVAMTDDTDNHHGFQIFDWHQATKNMILSSFFWGYILLQIPAGMLAGRYGGKWFLVVAMVSNGIVNLFLPIAAKTGGWVAVVVCRVFMGLTQGLLYPSIHGILGHWAPAAERSRMGTIVYAGSQLGTIIELILAGALSASSWGWPSVFYLVGIACLVWSVVWYFIGSSTPAECKFISNNERKFIEVGTGYASTSDKKHLTTPWKKIWTSLPFWSILISHCSQSLGFWTLLTEMPSYMKEVLNVNIKSNGLYSSLPYIAMYILSFVFSWLADYIINRNLMSMTATRKTFNTIAFWGPAAALLGLSYLPPGHLTLSIALLTVTVGLNGAHYVGFLLSHIDIAPNFSSTLMGLTNGFGNVFSIIAPLTVSMIITDEKKASEWRKVFFLSIVFYFLSNLFYLLFASGEVQGWNEPEANKTLDEEVEKASPSGNRRSKKNSLEQIHL